ncbi:hypothetical protein [Peribacillus sp. SI8-4]|uniref:hypothetical protein n=1 Tax=Peribacillus sp. SI8-4 TaxID=3048009 RepID=UPI0025529338|nr:hypothetical protein [Peribacillus sp. SI8-4]
MQSITNDQPASPSIEMLGTARLKNGQILFGKVNKVFPNQMAEVQIGEQKMIATLDTPLYTGARYWFQVHQQNEGKLVLRVLELPNANDSYVNGGAAAQLIAHLGMPSEPAAAKLAEYLLKNRLPITKETFESALQWIKAADSPEAGLPILKTMFVQQLPVVKEVFDALLAQAKGEPFHKLLATLQQQIQVMGQKTITSVKLLAVLEALQVAGMNHIQQTGLQQLVTTWLDSGSAAELKSGAFSLLQKTGFIPKEMSEYTYLNKVIDGAQARSGFTGNPAMDKLIKDLQILSNAKSGLTGELEKGESKLHRLMDDAGMKTQTPADIQQVQKKNLSTEKISSLSFHLLADAFAEATAVKKAESSNMSVNALLAYLNGNEGEVAGAKVKAAEMIQQSLIQHPPETMPLKNHEKRILANILESEYQTVHFTNGASVAHQLKELSKLLGLHLEHALINQSGTTLAESPQDLETLKPLLLKLLNEQPPANIKEVAEHLLNRITAQQILSQENGPLQNLLLTLPMNLGQTQTDLTMQWSGRKTEDGKIDPDYCRVLFYLELEGIKETVIDMQVQNRVISVTIINEQVSHMEEASKQYLSPLRGNLEKMDYRLSGVSFVNPKNGGKVPKSEPLQEAGSYSGVDIRI